MHLPLRLRLPNPPIGFEGRVAEAGALLGALATSKVAVVRGIGGVGKTSFVSHALAHRAEQTVYVRLAEGEPIEQALTAIARALGEATTDWAALARDREALLGAAIDHAEMHEAIVVIDDLHHAPRDAARDAIDAIARYARKTRWVVISREIVAVDQAFDLLLAGLPEEHLIALARRADAADPTEAARAAGGSPFRLKQIVAGVRPSFEPRRDGLELSGEAERIVRLLSATPGELPAKVFSDEAAVRELETRGLVERARGTIRVHDVARSFVTAQWSEVERAELRSRVVALLGDDLASRVEALCLHVEAGDVAAARAEIDANGEALLAAGFAPRLFRALERVRIPELESFRLRVAIESGEHDFELRMPPRPSVRDRCRHAEALLARGAYAEAHPQARAVFDETRDFEAGRLAARALLNSGAPDEAIAVLESLEGDDVATATRDADLAAALLLAGAREEARTLTEDLAQRLESLPPNTRHEVAYSIAYVRFALGRLREAEHALEAASAGTYVAWTPRRTFLRGAIAHARGAAEPSRKVLARLAPLRRASFSSSLFARLCSLLLEFDLDGIESAPLDALIADARERPDVLASALVLRIRQAIAKGETEVASLRAPRPEFRSPWSTQLDLHERLAAAHRGEVSPIDDRHEHAELRILAAIVRSAAALAAGQDGVARALAQKAIDEANAEGYGTLENEARVRAAEAGAPLGPLAGSPDLVAHARFFSFDPVALIEIAPGDGAASRRARALLGDEVVLDAIDRRVVERARTRLSVRRIGSTESGAFVPGLLLDDRDRSAHIGGRRIDFSARPLFWRIVRTLVDGGGVASKERLTLDAWEETEYHPLRHDGRIWVAIRKLRARLEDDAKNPRWLVTKDDGYAFGDLVRFVSKVELGCGAA